MKASDCALFPSRDRSSCVLNFYLLVNVDVMAGAKLNGHSLSISNFSSAVKILISWPDVGLLL